jgi:hypothetical protein
MKNSVASKTGIPAPDRLVFRVTAPHTILAHYRPESRKSNKNLQTDWQAIETLIENGSQL